MTEHLPECNYEKNPERNACICQRLRACEQRVLDVAREAVLGAKAIDVAHGRGLDEPAPFVWLNNALSAIDALRKDSHE